MLLMMRANPLMRTIRLFGGGALIAAGLVGLVMPVLPGWILIIPGLSLWSSEFVWAARLRHRVDTEWRRFRPSSSADSERDAA